MKGRFGRFASGLKKRTRGAIVLMENLEGRRLLSGQASAFEVSGLAPTSTVLQARRVENLDRGLVAINRGSGSVYLSWRLLGTEATTTTFNVYRSTNGGAAVKRNSTPISATTDYSDTGVNGSFSQRYFVRAVVNGVEQADSASFTLAANAPVQQFLNVPLQIPAGGTTPTGEAYTYSANDASVGDLDGDGQYEIILKWDPSNAKDNSQSGYTGNVYIDAYKLNGTQLWRIDLGRNIRAGAHYTHFIVYDFDSDGRSEIAVKTADGTVDGAGTVIGDGAADWRNSSGYILSGPEYLTVFNGQTGAAMSTVSYVVPRGTVSSWGDNYGNRVDRFLAGLAYLDGERPSFIMARGYYTRTVLSAWDWRDGQLTQRWLFDTGNSTTGPLAGYRGQGAHSLTTGDVDGDGRDEIVYGAMTVDDNGQPLYTTGLGHGDALHMSDMVPSRPGLEVFQVHEDANAHQGKGGTLRDARTGEVISFVPGTGDVGRGNAFDIDPRYPGYEMWNSSDGGIYAADGTRIQNKPSNMFQNFGVWWDGDTQRELLDGGTVGDWRITNGVGGRVNILTPSGIASNNGTKATPALSGDIIGDWREEIIWRKSDNTALQIWVTTTTSQAKIPTLMHDVQYREAIAWQSVGYNQPPHTSFFLGSGMAAAVAPNVVVALRPATGLSASIPSERRVRLSWAASPDSTTYAVMRGLSASGPFTEVASGVSGTTYTDETVLQGLTYHYRVVAKTAKGISNPTSTVAMAVPLPAGWSAGDIGTTGAAGSTTFAGGSWQLRGAGAGVGGAGEAYHFARRLVTGNSINSARLLSQDAGSRAGLMMRASDLGNAAFAAVLSTGGGGVSFSWRTAQGATGSIEMPSMGVGVWLRLARTGNTFTGLYSKNGLIWKTIGSADVSMSSSVRSGFVVSSGVSGVQAGAVFGATRIAVDAPSIIRPTVLA
jgi:rhamnogalacturonan endolyase